jgi:hypothetical protein
MERQHILLVHARTYDRFEGDLSPSGCEYDLSKGAWVLKHSGVLLVESPERPRPQTKKADIETGEDQKGY